MTTYKNAQEKLQKLENLKYSKKLIRQGTSTYRRKRTQSRFVMPFIRVKVTRNHLRQLVTPGVSTQTSPSLYRRRACKSEGTKNIFVHNDQINKIPDKIPTIWDKMWSFFSLSLSLSRQQWWKMGEKRRRLPPIWKRVGQQLPPYGASCHMEELPECHPTSLPQLKK